MAKANLEIPTEVLDKAAQQTIKAQAKEIASLKAKLARRDQKIKEFERLEQQEQQAVEAIKRFLEDVRYDAAFDSIFHPYEPHW